MPNFEQPPSGMSEVEIENAKFIDALIEKQREGVISKYDPKGFSEAEKSKFKELARRWFMRPTIMETPDVTNGLSDEEAKRYGLYAEGLSEKLDDAQRRRQDHGDFSSHLS